MRSHLSVFAALLLPLFLFASPVFGEGLTRTGNLVHDKELQLDWMWDANLADSLMTWKDANAWAENLEYGGHDDWRLPTTYDFVDTYQLTQIQLQYAENLPELQISEFGHLYTCLGLEAEQPLKDKSAILDNTFKGLQLGYYWLGTISATPLCKEDPITKEKTECLEAVWTFDFQHGTQFLTALTGIGATPAYAIAVRDVPEPATALLFATGLAGTFWSLRRTKS